MTETRSVTLRSTRDSGDTRYLGARMSGETLYIEGQDLGRTVQRIFGYAEYEWAYTIAPPEVAKLVAALDCGSDVLDALAARFSGDNSGYLDDFLTEHDVRYEFWSRVGD